MSEPSNYHESATGQELADAINRLYGDGNKIKSNTYKRSEEELEQTAEQRADYLFINGYMDEKMVSREYVVERIKKAMKNGTEYPTD